MIKQAYATHRQAMDATIQDIKAIRAELGLDIPLAELFIALMNPQPVQPKA